MTALSTQAFVYCAVVRRLVSCCASFRSWFGGSYQMLLGTHHVWVSSSAGGLLSSLPAASGFSSHWFVKSVYLSVYPAGQQKFHPQHFILCLAPNQHLLIMWWAFVQNAFSKGAFGDRKVPLFCIILSHFVFYLSIVDLKLWPVISFNYHANFACDFVLLCGLKGWFTRNTTEADFWKT